MKNKKGFVLSTYVYMLLVFFLLLLGTMLTVMNNTKLISNKLKEQSSNTSGLVDKDYSFVLLGDKDLTWVLGQEYNDAGFIAKTTNGKDLSEYVKIKSTVDVENKGDYKVIYTITYNGRTYNIDRNVSVRHLVNLNVDLAEGEDNVNYETKYFEGTKVRLTEPTREGYTFKGWTVEGTGSSVVDGVLVMGSAATTVTALWEEVQTATLGTQAIAALCTDDATCTANNLVKDADNNIRYIGSSPNNYIEFNGETWRIVGVFNVKKNANDTQGEQRIKIVKDEMLTKKAFDADSSQIWKGSDIESYLNGTTSGNYYYSLSDAAKGQIEKAVWNTGALAYNSSGTTPAAAYTQEKGTQTAESIVGLISVSDYGYAGGSTCTNLSDNTCGTSNWLKPSNWYWTITPHSGGSFYVWFVSGKASSNVADNASGRVRPAIYLKSNVNLTGTGENTSANIYKIS